MRCAKAFPSSAACGDSFPPRGSLWQKPAALRLIKSLPLQGKVSRRGGADEVEAAPPHKGNRLMDRLGGIMAALRSLYHNLP